MRRIAVALTALATASLGLVAALVPSASASTPGSAATHARQVCSTAPAGYAACFAQELVTAAGAHIDSTATPNAIAGKKPADIKSAYGLAGTTASGRTVAIVDAYGYPNAERDLTAYRKKFALPACTTANGCLTIINQNGGTIAPTFNLGWAQEQALDLDAVSATCPDCKILLVQTTSNSFTDLGIGANRAATVSGVKAISNSYGGGDVSDSSFGAPYNHPGIAVTASTGDNGFQGPSFPSSSAFVTAVGGTTLTKAASTPRGWSEKVWGGAGSGCTTLNARPTGQTTAMTKCSGRATADVSAVADPNTGLAVYAPSSQTVSGWSVYGGTSLSAPIIAAVYALSGNTAGHPNGIPYAHAAQLNDVTVGNNGTCANFCKAKVGYDGPTGLGTPSGVGAF